MHIAIIGTGLSGLATGYFLLRNSSHPIHITFFDPLGIGGGTSGMAAGLLHPYAGASAKLNRFGHEGYTATCQLLDKVSKKLGKPVASYEGLLRLAITDRQNTEYQLAADTHEFITWWGAEEVIQKIPGSSFYPGIFIKKAISVDCRSYLEGLWKICEEKGAQLEKSAVNKIEELKNFAQIVIATGASSNRLLTSMQLPITEVKGQVIELVWPKHLDPLPCALNSQAYLLMNREQASCLVGATYERNFDSTLTDVDYASKDILPKATALIPGLQEASILGCRAGIRASTPNHMPIVQKVDAKCWVITGMGSKGLLYHALYAEKLAHMIISSKDHKVLSLKEKNE